LFCNFLDENDKNNKFVILFAEDVEPDFVSSFPDFFNIPNKLYLKSLRNLHELESGRPKASSMPSGGALEQA